MCITGQCALLGLLREGVIARGDCEQESESDIVRRCHVASRFISSKSKKPTPQLGIGFARQEIWVGGALLRAV